MNDLKTCLECKQQKTLSDFYKDKTRKEGYTHKCKICIKINNSTQYYSNPEKHKSRCLEWQKNNQNKQQLLNQKSYNKLKENEDWKKNKYEYNTTYHKTKYNTSLEYKIYRILRNRFRAALKKQIKTTSAVELIGCDIDHLKEHISSNFLPEMNWENHGVVWEIDHIKPCALFDLTYREQQKECFHYTNLQPLFKTSDIAKSFGYINQIGNRNKNKKYER